MLRITTRLAHSRSGVVRRESRAQNEIKLPENLRQFVLLPSIARKQYRQLLNNQAAYAFEGTQSGFNEIIDAADKSMGIIACGLAFNYLLENYSDRNIPFPVLKLTQYPMPEELVRKFYDMCDSILVLEDGYPIVEEAIKGFLNLGKTVKGRLDGTVPRDGELNPNIVAVALGMENSVGDAVPELVAGRPPSLCNGCPHIDSYQAMTEALDKWAKGRVFSDIGCYTLGALAPFEAINTCVDMGASITMAKGAADAGLFPAVAVIGDSTFTHSGITGLLDAVNDNSPITVIILDNATTGMTGGQTSSALGKIEAICQGVGVDPEHIHIIKPLRKNHEDNVEIFRKEFEYQGVSVIIPRRECIQTLNKRMRMKFAEKKK
jgi:indolepyruvate ferredoxin oxidoreductase, alpha subunit